MRERKRSGKYTNVCRYVYRYLHVYIYPYIHTESSARSGNEAKENRYRKESMHVWGGEGKVGREGVGKQWEGKVRRNQRTGKQKQQQADRNASNIQGCI